MTTISIFYASFCGHEEIIDRCARVLNCRIIDDQYLIRAAADRFDMPEHSVTEAILSHKPTFTPEKEKSVACLKFMLAAILHDAPLIVSGYCSHLIPKTIDVLRVNLISDINHRIQNVIKDQGLSRNEAIAMISGHDSDASRWHEYLYLKSPWHYKQYDLVVDMSEKSLAETVAAIVARTGKDLFQRTGTARQAIEDFQLAAEVEIALAEAGHCALVETCNGNVDLTIPHHLTMCSRLEEELIRIVRPLPGVLQVSIGSNPGVPSTGALRPNDEHRSRLLLVDDEKEFVHTLAERLLMREICSAVVYDGEQALSFVETDRPEVIVLDLKMPGMNGIEVLRRVKNMHPDIQVIILTGHGSREDECVCMELGAFAYLQKPVDIEVLTGLLDKAKQRS
jgi:two-component system, OmpR family, response regulator CpxR